MLKNNRFKLEFVFSKKVMLFASVMVLFAVYLAGCVNVDQKTTLKQDGSGSMKVHYWTKMSNVKSSTELGNFSFDKDKAKTNYTSSNTEVGDVKIEDKLEDSTKHVTLDLKFKNINDISSAKAFEKVKASWKEGKDGMDFTYTLLKDTSNAGNMGASDTKLDYEFDFPAEVLRTNGTKDQQKVKWNKTLADLKNDIDMTATVKNEGKKCGLFGMELPLIMLAGLAVMSIRVGRKK